MFSYTVRETIGGKRTSSTSLFDVTMGGFDGVESCELVDSYYYILSQQSMETTSVYIEMTN